MSNDNPNPTPDANPLPEPNNRIFPAFDHPEAALRISIENHERKVHVLYNKPVMVLILSPSQARGLALQILLHAEKITSTPKPTPPIP